MILNFKNQINEKPTYFAEKIWRAIDVFDIVPESECIEYSNSKHQANLEYNLISSLNPKIHTIRKDTKNRWKAGNKIHPYYFSRTKNMVQFAPTFECKGIQSIEIKPNDKFFNKNIVVIGSFNMLDDDEIERLAINDGFDSVDEFFNWFNTDFTGKIIHFTNLRY